MVRGATHEAPYTLTFKWSGGPTPRAPSRARGAGAVVSEATHEADETHSDGSHASWRFSEPPRPRPPTVSGDVSREGGI